MEPMLGSVSLPDVGGLISDLFEKLGGANGQQWLAALEAGGNKIGDWARQILAKTTLSATPSEIELVVVKGSDVGLEGEYTTAQMYSAAEAHGLSKCPAEVGPQLRLQYPNQPKGEWLVVASVRFWAPNNPV